MFIAITGIFNVDISNVRYLHGIKKIKHFTKLAIMNNTMSTKIKIDKLEKSISECDHINVEKKYIQIRAADEAETCITICIDCKRKI